jgi:hypothetical protein
MFDCAHSWGYSPHFGLAIVAADPASALITLTVRDIPHFGLALMPEDPALGLIKLTVGGNVHVGLAIIAAHQA